MGSTFVMPRFFVLQQSSNPGNFIRYVEGGAFDQYLSASESRPTSPFAKLEVEQSTKYPEQSVLSPPLVHIRSCQNNKYLEISRNTVAGSDQQHWLTASADKPEEDISKESCTLFWIQGPITGSPNAAYIQHFQSKRYLRTWTSIAAAAGGLDWPVVAVIAQSSSDSPLLMLNVIDWQSLVILPRYVAFKGDNDRYLCLRQLSGQPYLQFSSDDIGDPTVACEVSYNRTQVHIKSVSANRFWRLEPGWLWIRPDSVISSDDATLFRPIKVDDNTIGLANTRNVNPFCWRRTANRTLTDCLAADRTSLTREAHLTVVEPIFNRRIYGARYNLANARVYNQQAVLVSRNSASNFGSQDSTIDLTLSFTDTSTSSFNSNFSLTLGASYSFELGFVKIKGGSLEISAEISAGVEWGTVVESTQVRENVYKVVVPSMTKVTVDCVAMSAMCDVPFTYSQRDTLYNGHVVITSELGGVFHGANYFDIDFVTTQEKLIS